MEELRHPVVLDQSRIEWTIKTKSEGRTVRMKRLQGLSASLPAGCSNSIENTGRLEHLPISMMANSEHLLCRSSSEHAREIALPSNTLAHTYGLNIPVVTKKHILT